MRNDKLHPSEYMEFAPTECGVQTRNSHKGCESGTRRRLYVTRTDSTTVKAFCHNCGKGGVSSCKTRTPTRKSVITKGNSPIPIPTDLMHNMSEWPLEARVQMYKYRLYGEQRELHMAYSPSHNRVFFIGSYNQSNYEMVYSGRYVGDAKKANVPKWIHTRKSPTDLMGLHDGGFDRFVFVEDPISCMRVCAATGYGVSALLGTHLSDEIYNYWVVDRGWFKHHPVYVWLDYDARDKARKMAARLRLVCPDVYLVVTEKDPKEYSDDEIEEHLKNAKKV